MNRSSDSLKVIGTGVRFPASDVYVRVTRTNESLTLTSGNAQLRIVDLILRLPCSPSLRSVLGFQSYRMGVHWRFDRGRWPDLPSTTVGLEAWTRGYSSSPLEIPTLDLSLATNAGRARLFHSGQPVVEQSRWLTIRDLGDVSEEAALAVVAFCLHGFFGTAAGSMSFLPKILGRGTEIEITKVPQLEDLFSLQARLERKRRRFESLIPPVTSL